jgi:pimeloyl-ACP methyl ester carboxylesterase
MGLARWLRDSRESFQPKEYWAPVNGHRMHFLQTGAGPELILLHGLVGTAAAWRHTIPTLASASTVYSVDALGIGRSERVSGLDARLAAQADRVVGFMDAVGIASSDFLATSHGGAVALTVAARHPERVRTLALHAPANPFSHVTDASVRFYQSRTGRWFAHRIPSLSKSVQSLALLHVCGDGQVPENSLDTYMGSVRVPGTIDYLLRLLEGWFTDMQDLETALDRVQEVPILLLWGDRDRVVSLESGRRLHDLLIRSELVVLPGIGHLPYDECPRIFAEAVNSFLSRERLVFPSPLAEESTSSAAGAAAF